jgi:hypothetical protein
MSNLKKKKNNDMFEESPLLAKDTSDFGNESDVGLHSTIHPERFDMSRFSDRKEDEESSFRIILYVLMVIVIGVGLALLVRYMISKNDDTDGTNDDNTEVVETDDNDTINIQTAVRADSTASNRPANADFVDSSVVTLGDTSVAPANVSMASITYTPFTSFGRLEFATTGATSLPRVTGTFDNQLKRLNIQFPSNMQIGEEFKEDIQVSGIVDRITFNNNNNTYSVVFKQSSKYRLSANGSTLVVDVKTEEQIALDVDTEDDTTPTTTGTGTTSGSNTATTGSTTTGTTGTSTATGTATTGSSSSTTTTTGTTTKPTTINYKNDFSKNQQFIVSNVNTASITHNTFFYEDTANYFEFAFGGRNQVGEKFIPNATATLVKENGKVYIDLTIENLAGEAFTAEGITSTELKNRPIDLSGANFVKITRTSFSDGVAKYRIELKKEADFRLVSEPTIDGSIQVLAIQIKD